MKVDVDKLDITKLVNFSIKLNHLKAMKAYDLGVSKLKTVPGD